jgi:hypothetical protein
MKEMPQHANVKTTMSLRPCPVNDVVEAISTRVADKTARRARGARGRERSREHPRLLSRGPLNNCSKRDLRLTASQAVCRGFDSPRRRLAEIPDRIGGAFGG